MSHAEESAPKVEVIVLASGSSGNACLLNVDGFGLLIDAGLGPRKLASQLKRVGAGWPSIQAAILTHTHSDHWNDRTLSRFSKMGIMFYCHPDHQYRLKHGLGLVQLQTAGLLRFYSEEEPIEFPGGMHCRAVPVRHDSGAAFGFRFERAESGFCPAWAMGFASDLGCWDTTVAEAFANVDVLALEYNHDEVLQKNSRRPRQLIERVLGDEGHLSNIQAAALTAEIIQQSAPNRLATLIQLHLSRDCNRPQLAKGCAESILKDLSHSCLVHPADQFDPLVISCQGEPSPPSVRLGGSR